MYIGNHLIGKKKLVSNKCANFLYSIIWKWYAYLNKITFLLFPFPKMIVYKSLWKETIASELLFGLYTSMAVKIQYPSSCYWPLNISFPCDWTKWECHVLTSELYIAPIDIIIRDNYWHLLPLIYCSQLIKWEVLGMIWNVLPSSG